VALLPDPAQLPAALEAARQGHATDLTPADVRRMVTDPEFFSHASAENKAVFVELLKGALASEIANALHRPITTDMAADLAGLRATVSAPSAASSTGEAEIGRDGTTWRMNLEVDASRPAGEQMLALVGEAAHEIGHLFFRDLSLDGGILAEEAWVHGNTVLALERPLPAVAAYLDLKMSERVVNQSAKKVLVLHYDSLLRMGRRSDVEQEIKKAMAAVAGSEGRREIVLLVSAASNRAAANALARPFGVSVIDAGAALAQARPVGEETRLEALAREQFGTAQVQLAAGVGRNRSLFMREYKDVADLLSGRPGSRRAAGVALRLLVSFNNPSEISTRIATVFEAQVFAQQQS
jgi:hypothetical protein